MSAEYRIGHGYDLHRLEPCAPHGSGRPFVLGGVSFEHDRGPVAHSDGDVLMHAVTDAILGAIGAPDIGNCFQTPLPRMMAAQAEYSLKRPCAACTLPAGTLEIWT